MKVAVTNPAEVTAIPPWDRDDFFWREVPAVMKRMHNWPVALNTVERWIRKGVKNRAGETVYLKVFYRRSRMFIVKADLFAFLDAT